MWGIIGLTAAAHAAFSFHTNLPHLASNMIALWIFGENVEDQVGHGRFLLFYVVCGAASAAAQAWTGSPVVAEVAGASGAVAGILGAYFVMFFHSRVLVRVPFTIVEVPALFFLALWFLAQVLVADRLTTLAACAGGLVTGAALIRLCRRPERARWEWREE